MIEFGTVTQVGGAYF